MDSRCAQRQYGFGRRRRRIVGCIALPLAILGAFSASPAWAHKLIVFAAVQGKTIQGEAYYQDGSPAQSAAVSILGAAGETLGTTTTDGEGKFTYQPRSRRPHRFVVDVGLGHRAEYTVPAEELPSDLPTKGVGESLSGALKVSPASPTNAAAQSRELPSESQGNLAAEVHALDQQIAALRADLQKWKTSLRLQDVLGGVGYILGVLGVLSYVLAGRRRGKASQGRP